MGQGGAVGKKQRGEELECDKSAGEKQEEVGGARGHSSAEEKQSGGARV